MPPVQITSEKTFSALALDDALIIILVESNKTVDNIAAKQKYFLRSILVRVLGVALMVDGSKI